MSLGTELGIMDFRVPPGHAFSRGCVSLVEKSIFWSPELRSWALCSPLTLLASVVPVAPAYSCQGPLAASCPLSAWAWAGLKQPLSPFLAMCFRFALWDSLSSVSERLWHLMALPCDISVPGRCEGHS